VPDRRGDRPGSSSPGGAFASRRLAALSALLVAACSPGEPGVADANEAALKGALPEASADSAPALLPDASAAPPADIEGMALIPAGPFTMGADQGGELDERPAHAVTLPAYYLDLTEVTNEAYKRCIDAGACPPPDPSSAELNHFGRDAKFRGPRRPVSSISWESARGYCAWVGKRLPSEAEWEKAARDSDGRRFPWGAEAPTADRAVFRAGVTAEVGTHPRGDGPYGHHDLAGNVWEWVEDAYDPYAYTRPGAPRGAIGSCDDALAALAELRSHRSQGFTGSNPIPIECERVLRGGAFNYHAQGLRSSNRVHHPPRFHLVMSGFRCAKDAGAR
jgi:formylglycine-generating enzyme required for sulfatase activity